MADYQAIILAAISALSSGVGVGMTLKTDVRWLRILIEKLDERITRLENRSSD